MDKLLGFVGVTAGGAVGWRLGQPLGFFAAFLLSTLGSGVGLYVARRFSEGSF